jgi:2,5-diketo-D-gluconate reductase A
MTQNKLTLNNGVEMPALGLGVFQSSPEETVGAVETALGAGYRLIDTAAGYFNERQVGEGIRRSGVDRSEIFVTTKLWVSDYGYDAALHGFDTSMAKLGLDYLDLYLLHWPLPSDFDATVGAYKAAEKLLADGRVRAIGVCNFYPEHLDALAERTEIVPAVNQVELHPLFAQPGLQAADRERGVITQAWSPIGGINVYSEGADPSLNVLQNEAVTTIGDHA